jgi:O-methyltransferase
MNLYQKFLRGVRKAVAGSSIRFTYAADGFGVRKKYVPFLNDTRFNEAWQETMEVNANLWGDAVPDIRWRCHICAWAAQNCLRLDGDFAEFGVNTGILSSMILKTTGFASSDKRFFLFDTFAGVPEDMATDAEKIHVQEMNATIYSHDILTIAKKVFSPFDNVEFVIGRLPESLGASGLGKIAYASIDLNSVVAEMAVAEHIWERMTPGGMIVLDDYGFGGHEEQREAWDQFAANNNRVILAVPTGQGILMK